MASQPSRHCRLASRRGISILLLNLYKLLSSTCDSLISARQYKILAPFYSLHLLVPSVPLHQLGQLKQESMPEGVDWQGLDQKDLATLILSVKPSQLSYIKHCVHSFEAWIKLRDVHQPKGPVRKVALYKKLLGLRMADGQSMSSHINDFVGNSDQLAAIGIGVDDWL
ncbi:GM12070 [Drosophila sechellia]|uniref:GM12070 n=1 Tax=Drosophila sechellia TaxID=7238 RepID=B4IN11_DROSE|nr:GM12070 [Drosophila sechellia]